MFGLILCMFASGIAGIGVGAGWLFISTHSGTQSTSTQIMPCANCSKCHWFNHCVCTFGSDVCRIKYEPRTAQSGHTKK